jgi:hypothetical protein
MRTIRRGKLVSAALLVAIPALYGATLQPLSRTRISVDVHGKGVPTLGAGALLLPDDEGSPTPRIGIIDLVSGAAETTSFEQVAGAERVWFRGVARGADGTVVSSGLMFDHEGRCARFLLIQSPGKASQLIRTAQYQAQQITIAKDGSIWTAGIEGLDHAPAGESGPEAALKPFLSSGVIRHFTAQGAPAGSFVAQSSLRSVANVLHYDCRLQSVGSEVVWYCPGEQRLVEVANSGIVRDQPGVVAPGSLSNKPAGLSGIAMTPSGRFFLAAQDGPGKWTIFELDRRLSMWAPVKTFEEYVILYGAQGEHLVVSSENLRSVDLLRVAE